jgi:hypothetical protein
MCAPLWIDLSGEMTAPFLFVAREEHIPKTAYPPSRVSSILSSNHFAILDPELDNSYQSAVTITPT